MHRPLRTALRLTLAVAALARLPGCSGARVPSTTAPAGQWRANRARLGATAPVRGAPNGRVVMEVFSDFECPFCSRVGPTIETILSRYGSEVQVVWRDYPLPMHPDAMPAAEAAREAFAQQGSAGFWRYHDMLFAHQNALARRDLEHYAELLDLDLEHFRAALDQHTHRAAIQGDIAAADAAGVDMGTPAFFINGRFLAGALPFAEFQPIIEQEISRLAPACESPAATSCREHKAPR